MEKTSVALLGLGTMGAGMASNLLKASFPLAIYNRTQAKAEPFVSRGARLCSSPSEAAERAQVIISMLSNDEASEAAWLGDDGALSTAKPGTVLVEASTVSPVWIAKFSERATSSGCELLDAPVTGSRLQAEAGTLTFLVGGSARALEQASPVLQAISKEIVHLGPSGSGATLKLINNFLCGVQAASLAEAIAWLERTGLDRDASLTILKNGAPGSPLFSALSARMTARDYTVNFLLGLMAKDLAYAQTAAESAGIQLTTAANAGEVFERAAADGYADQDMSAIVEVLRNS